MNISRNLINLIRMMRREEITKEMNVNASIRQGYGLSAIL